MIAIRERRTRRDRRRSCKPHVNGTAAGVAGALFDDRDAFTPTEHIWVSDKIAWVRIGDDLPQFLEGPP